MNPSARALATLLIVALPVSSVSAGDTTLGTSGSRFTINGQPTFLVGVSYYGGLGASPETLRQDLDALQAAGINWLRVWATWDAFEEDVSAVDAAGRSRAPYLDRLQSLVAQCDQRQMIVDVTLARSKPAQGAPPAGRIPDLTAHLQAARTIITALGPHRNWYLDLANERDVRDARFVAVAELKQLRQLARQLAPELLVTASFGGHDLSETDIRDVLEGMDGDFLAVHRPRHAGTAEQTETKTRTVLKQLKAMGLTCPVHHQEPFRRGYARWEPSAEDFLTDLRGALRGGAAGWCFHNGATRTRDDQQPRRSFDLRQRSLIDQLDAEERQVLGAIRAIVNGS